MVVSYRKNFLYILFFTRIVNSPRPDSYRDRHLGMPINGRNPFTSGLQMYLNSL